MTEKDIYEKLLEQTKLGKVTWEEARANWDGGDYDESALLTKVKGKVFLLAIGGRPDFNKNVYLTGSIAIYDKEYLGTAKSKVNLIASFSDRFLEKDADKSLWRKLYTEVTQFNFESRENKSKMKTEKNKEDFFNAFSSVFGDE